MSTSTREGWGMDDVKVAAVERARVAEGRAAEYLQQVNDRDRFIALDRSIIEQRDKKIKNLERLLYRAYPWLHNPYHGTTDIANAAEGDAVIEAVQFAIQHVPDEPDPLLKLPCGSCDGDGCQNCRDR